MKELSTQTETAKYLGVSTRVLYELRGQGKGPAYLRLGDGPKAPIRYRKADVDAWLEKAMVYTA